MDRLSDSMEIPAMAIATEDIAGMTTITMVIEPDIIKKQRPDGSPSGRCFFIISHICFIVHIR
ncbi:hypothetical protein Ccel_2897 [Ruminiclostridium cellulolyticum H10]|uniref:Uncharacterized protein n=1 Tax=Ruminiclostridium cellulolyticum (strain ATCC 35319 / DSM 5812 / JCM 6584 / H10) TaxID=394503 RepID=B8I891_RUMCH|nr:hypothetical protein Ccel_2897 [Ruminiclostridium cellulolyticum H10]